MLSDIRWIDISMASIITCVMLNGCTCFWMNHCSLMLYTCTALQPIEFLFLFSKFILQPSPSPSSSWTRTSEPLLHGGDTVPRTVHVHGGLPVRSHGRLHCRKLNVCAHIHLHDCIIETMHSSPLTFTLGLLAQREDYQWDFTNNEDTGLPLWYSAWVVTHTRIGVPY